MPEDTIRTNVILPRSLHRAVRQMALDTDSSLAEITRRALEEYLERQRGESS